MAKSYTPSPWQAGEDLDLPHVFETTDQWKKWRRDIINQILVMRPKYPNTREQLENLSSHELNETYNYLIFRESRVGTAAMTSVDINRLRELCSKVTNNELYTVVYFEAHFPDPHPIFGSGETKKERIEYLVRWVSRFPNEETTRLIFDALEKKVGEKAQYPVSGPVPGTKYITWDEFTALKSYPMIASAVSYKHDYRRVCDPRTKDGYVSVDAIYNMSAWANWKSSSLGAQERQVANAIDDLKLGQLMKLNTGRRANQPALFPVGLLT